LSRVSPGGLQTSDPSGLTRDKARPQPRAGGGDGRGRDVAGAAEVLFQRAPHERLNQQIG